jgi:hypothetical protein
VGLSRVGGSATTIHQFQNWVRCIRARAANGSGPLKFISPAQSHAACFSEEDPFCLPLFRAPFFGFRMFLFFGIFSEGPTCCIRLHVSHHVKAAKLVAMVPALRHYFSGFFGRI